MSEARFSNTVKTEWLDGNKREMRLLEEVFFDDGKGGIWTAESGDIIDGASIPKFLWHIVGSPFVGKYRRASVLHDVYCKNKKVNSAAVHRMFCDAMCCDDVTETKAKLMYNAVRWFGPRF